jgi:nucleoside-diphosphate-sugar epimerase
MEKHLRITPAKLLRILTDAVLVNLSVITALAVRYLYQMEFQHDQFYVLPRTLFWLYGLSYAKSFVSLTLCSLVIFYLSGFYTYGRAYSSRYKVLVVTQAVCSTYLIWGFISYFFSWALPIPRGAWVMACGMTVATLVVARVWSLLWKRIVTAEHRQLNSGRKEAGDVVLVIGGAGYIGSGLIPKLLNRGYKVRLLDILLYGIEPIQDFINHPNLEIVEADFRQVDTVVAAMRNVGSVVHLGAIVGDPACALDKELTIEINLMATRMIAEVARGMGVKRFVFASTCSVYGASDELLDEQSTLNPVSLYAQSKIASENVLRSLANDEFSPTILRFATIHGLSGRTRFDLVINLLSAKAVVDGKITVQGGDQWRPFLHVDDAALAVLTALEAPREAVHNQILNVGSDDQNYTLLEAGRLINRKVPSAEIIESEWPGDRRNYRVNFEKIIRVLNFRPQFNLEYGIQQVIDVCANGSVVDYTDAKYSNVKFLNETGITSLIRNDDHWAHRVIEGLATPAAYSPLMPIPMSLPKLRPHLAAA